MARSRARRARPALPPSAGPPTLRGHRDDGAQLPDAGGRGDRGRVPGDAGGRRAPDGAAALDAPGAVRRVLRRGRARLLQAGGSGGVPRAGRPRHRAARAAAAGRGGRRRRVAVARPRRPDAGRGRREHRAGVLPLGDVAGVPEDRHCPQPRGHRGPVDRGVESRRRDERPPLARAGSGCRSGAPGEHAGDGADAPPGRRPVRPPRARRVRADRGDSGRGGLPRRRPA